MSRDLGPAAVVAALQADVIELLRGDLHSDEVQQRLDAIAARHASATHVWYPLGPPEAASLRTPVEVRDHFERLAAAAADNQLTSISVT